MPTNTQLIKQMLACMKYSTKDNGWDLRTAMEETFGFKVLGGGQCSVAMEHPTNPNLVIKTVTKTDDGGMDFAAWVYRQQMQGRRSKHLPMIVEFHEENGRAVIIMERLYVTGSARFGYGPYPDVVNEWKHGKCSTDPIVAEYFDLYGPPDDLHSGNWMLREDGTPVIIDPHYRRSHRKDLNWQSYYHEGRLHVHAQIINDPAPLKPMVRDDMGIVHGRFEWGPNPMMFQQIEKRDPGIKPNFIHAFDAVEQNKRRFWPLVGLDFNAAEMRALKQIDELAKAHAEVMHNQFDQHFMNIMHGKRAGMFIADDIISDKRALRDRTPLVKDGSPASIRAEKEDHMLRIRSQHDHQSQRKGIQRSLLPGQVARRVQGTWCAQFDRVATAEGGIAGTTGRATGPPAGLHIGDTSVGKGMAA